MKRYLITKNIDVGYKRTSVRLEPELWEALKQIGKKENISQREIMNLVHTTKKENQTLTSAIRVFIMKYYKTYYEAERINFLEHLEHRASF